MTIPNPIILIVKVGHSMHGLWLLIALETSGNNDYYSVLLIWFSTPCAPIAVIVAAWGTT